MELMKTKQFGVNGKKVCVIFSYFVFLVLPSVTRSPDGEKPEHKRTENKFQLQQRKTLTEKESFIGFLAQVGRMIPYYETRAPCINKILQEYKGNTDEWQRIIRWLTDELTSSPVLQPYSLDNKRTMKTHASERMIGRDLIHKEHLLSVFFSPNPSKSQ